MNWNGYDTKYIIKRLIIGFGMLILFSILTANRAKADTLSERIWYDSSSVHPLKITAGNYQNTVNFPLTNINSGNPFYNKGEGTVVFTFLVRYGTTSNIVNAVTIQSGSGNAYHNTYTCKIGTAAVFIDSAVQNTVFTAECPVNFYNDGIKQISFMRNDQYGELEIYISRQATFFSKPSTTVNVDTNSVVNAQQQSTTDLLNGMQYSYQQINTVNQQIAQQAHADAQQAHQDAQAINNSINNDNITSGDADTFANNDAFSDTTGLESVINLPLNMVNSLSNECVPIQLHIPYLDTDATIPCMSTIYRTKFNNLYTLVKLVVNGFLVYRILLKVYELVHEAKQPDEDKLEVIEL